MTIADEARDSALHCEMVKYALRQNKDGVVVSFVVHPNDIPAALSTSHIGSRWMCALVQIGDDERPIPPARKGAMPNNPEQPIQPNHSGPDNARPLPESDKPSAGAKREKMDWRDVQPAAQAGIRCAEPTFHAFLSEVKKYGHYDEQSAARLVRVICNVNSRAELGTVHAARVIWHQLDTEYQAWLQLERV